MEEAEGQSAAVVGPSYGESGTLQVAALDSPQGGGGEAEKGLAHQSEALERMKSHLGWAL